MIFSNKFYDALKSVALIWLPALATLYFAIASIWGIPDTTAVIGTMTAVDTFLGAVLKLSSNSYPGDGVLTTGANGMTVHLPLSQDEATSKSTVTLKVQPGPDGAHQL